MKKFKVKFFGAIEERTPLKQVKTVVEAERAADVERVLRRNYEVINGLKIREIKDEE